MGKVAMSATSAEMTVSYSMMAKIMIVQGKSSRKLGPPGKVPISSSASP
jgi:hypothetical protein